MAIGNFRLASETYHGVHVGAGTGRMGPARGVDAAGAFGSAFRTTIQAGLDWYQGVIEVGKARQQAGRMANSIQQKQAEAAGKAAAAKKSAAQKAGNDAAAEMERAAQSPD